MTSLRAFLGAASPAAIVLACAVPFVFLHPHYQPHLAVGQVDVDLSDLAILAAALAGLWDGARRGWAPLRAGRAMWPWFVAFLVLLVVSIAWARYEDHAYSVSHHLVSALKYCEYAVLAFVATLALRTRDDRNVFYWAVALWTSFLVLIAALQFLGVVTEFQGKRPVQREPSYIGIHDLGALSGGALAFLFAAIVIPPARARQIVSGVAGALGVALAAAMDAVGGMTLSAIAIIGLARGRTLRQILAIAGICLVVAGAAVELRSSSIVAFMRFLGIKQNNTATSEAVQSYAQRVLLSYIGVRVWLEHPVVGAGWQESHEPHSFEPILPAAHRHFHNQPAQAFPSREHEWGVQNGIVQTLSDLGAVGLALLAATFFGAFRLLVRVSRRGPPELAREALGGIGWLIVGLAVFTGSGLLPGLAVDAQLWLGLGLAAALHHSLTDAG